MLANKYVKVLKSYPLVFFRTWKLNFKYSLKEEKIK